MFTDEKKEQKKKMTEPNDLMMGMMVGTGVEFQHIVMELMQEYKKKGIKEIQISVLEDAVAQAAMRNLGPNGLVGMMIKEGGNKCR